MTSHSDALFSMCRTQAHFIQIILSRISRSAMLLSLILTIDSWKASVTTLRSEISESHHHSLISRSLWVRQDRRRSISDHFFFHCLSNFLFDSWDVLESLNSRRNELSIRIWQRLHHHDHHVWSISFEQTYDTVSRSNSREISSCDITYFRNDLDLSISQLHHLTTLFERHCAFTTHDLDLLLLLYRYTQSLSKVITQW